MNVAKGIISQGQARSYTGGLKSSIEAMNF